MQKGCTLNKIQIVLKSFVPVLFYNLSLIIYLLDCIHPCIETPLDHKFTLDDDVPEAVVQWVISSP